MNEDVNRYKQLDRMMSWALIADAAVFILYLFGAGFGVLWLKVLTAIITICVSGLCLYILYLTKELTRHRSLWMTLGAGAILLLVLLSLILGYPGPKLS